MTKENFNRIMEGLNEALDIVEGRAEPGGYRVTTPDQSRWLQENAKSFINPVKIITYLKIRQGARTGHVASFFGITTDHARQHMTRMERLGHVRRSERYSAVNDIYWEAVT